MSHRKVTTIDDIMHPAAVRADHMAILDRQIRFLNHALQALQPRAATGSTHTVRVSPEADTQAAQDCSAADPNCTDCRDTGIREHFDRMVCCWCEAGDSKLSEIYNNRV